MVAGFGVLSALVIPLAPRQFALECWALTPVGCRMTPAFRLLCTFGVLLSLAAQAACDDDDGGGGDEPATTGSGGSCEMFAFEYEGEPDGDGTCPRLECCQDNPDGTFSAFSAGMCLSAADCDAVCADPDAAFECL